MTAKLELLPIYPITASSEDATLDHTVQVRAFLKAGIRLFQVREKRMDDRPYYHQLIEIRRLCDQFSARFLVNDRIDLAQASGADGVHLGQTDLPVAVVRGLLRKNAIVGISTHDRAQFLAAQKMDVDYVALGPVFETGTKRSPYRPLGQEFVREMVQFKRHPLVAIGGINLENAPAVWGAGADSVAVISNILNAPNPEQRICEYLKRGRQ